MNNNHYYKTAKISNLHDSTPLYDILILVVYIYGGSIFIYSIHIHNTLFNGGFGVLDTGSTLSAAPEVVHSYRTGRTTEFVIRL